MGLWVADDAGDAGSGVGAGNRLDACVELLDLGRLVLVDRRWAARRWMEGSWVVAAAVSPSTGCLAVGSCWSWGKWGTAAGEDGVPLYGTPAG
ncbi:hypothetical protein ACLOJK_022887, partial [Asimina triloba]